MTSLVLHAGDLDPSSGLVVEDEIRELAQAHTAESAFLVDEAEMLRLFADLMETSVKVIPETIRGRQGSLGVVVDHFIDFPLHERMHDRFQLFF